MSKPDVQQILKGFGLSEESVERVRLSRGVVGRTTYAVVAFLGVIAVAVTRAPADGLLWLCMLAAAVFLLFFCGVLWFANKNPGAALLEGAELLHWQQTALAAKGTGPIERNTELPVPPALPTIPAPLPPAAAVPSVPSDRQGRRS